MSASPNCPIEFTKLDLAVELPPEETFHANLDDEIDDDLQEDSEDEFAFTKEYNFSVADPHPPPPAVEKDPIEDQDSAEDLSKFTAVDLLLRQMRHSRPAFVPPPEPLVQIQVRTIDRKLIPPGAFHIYMDNLCEDFLQFSVAVFTSDGRISNSLVSPNSPHKGTGVWGSEINHGKLAYIETLRVNPKYQRRGVGRWAIEALLKSPVLADCPFIFTWATALNTASFFGPPDPDFGKKKNGVIAFWRALGFRRVGGTWFFGYARDPQHPMRSLRAADDVEATQVKGSTSEDVIMQYHGWS